MYQKGDRIDQFEVQGILGRGGFGVVYLVRAWMPDDISAAGGTLGKGFGRGRLQFDAYATFALKTFRR